MKITFGFDVKSINKAIDAIKNVEKQYNEQIVADLLNGCSRWLIGRANELLALTDIGWEVKNGIMNGWSVVQDGNIATITNTDDKAVFVEFGVGAVGGEKQNRHHYANKLGNNYEYNMPSDYKYAGQYHDDDTWRFYVNNESEIDLADGNYEVWNTKSGKLKIITRGSPSAMYAYKALVDLHDYGAKEVWEQIKKKYWG